MKTTLILSSFLLSLSLLPADEKPNPEYSELGETIAYCLSKGDIIELSHCWSSMRSARLQIADLRSKGHEVPQAEVDEAFFGVTERNKFLLKALITIDDAITAAGVDRKTIKLSSITAHGERTDPDGQKRTGGFDVILTSDKGKLELDLDDGGKIEGHWYVLDMVTGFRIAGEHVTIEDPRIELQHARRKEQLRR